MGLLDNAPKIDEPPRLPRLDWTGDAVAWDGDVPTLRFLVDGEWREARETFDVVTPIDGGQLARAQRASRDDVEQAIAAAARARDAWAGTPAAERIELCEAASDLMEERLDTIAGAITLDLGKVRSSSESEAEAAAERLAMVREEVRKITGEYLLGDWIPDTVGKQAVVLREPVGTVAAIGPFNYPLFLSASKIIPAIAAGNTVVAKAPSDDPVPLTLFARVLQEIGLPTGVLNVVTGSGREIGDLFANHPEIGMVSFTGSSAVGRHISEIAGPKRLHLELGGNAAGIVLDDADLDQAVEGVVKGGYKSAGQRCDAISRVLVQRDVYDEFVDRLVKSAATWTLGDPRAEDAKVGPLVSPDAAERVAGYVQDAVDKGSEVLLGGNREAAYFEPTVLAGVPLEAEVLWEEHFGPVLPVLPIDGLDEALEIANRSRFGLDSAVFTTKLEHAWKAARALQCGMVTINDAPAHGVGHFPFGGRKPDSGIGREGLGYSIDECTELKTVVMPA
jgi:acyl-CoA reductase-like NAD-dependent aldehyde dehydrogenase